MKWLFLFLFRVRKISKPSGPSGSTIIPIDPEAGANGADTVPSEAGRQNSLFKSMLLLNWSLLFSIPPMFIPRLSLLANSSYLKCRWYAVPPPMCQPNRLHSEWFRLCNVEDAPLPSRSFDQFMSKLLCINIVFLPTRLKFCKSFHSRAASLVRWMPAIPCVLAVCRWISRIWRLDCLKMKQMSEAVPSFPSQ